MLSAQELAALVRGQVLKRVIRAAAALNDLFDDVALARAVRVGRGAVNGWWKGAKPNGATIVDLARATGLSADELYRFLYADGPAPTLPAPGSPVESSVREGLRLDQQRPLPGGPDRPGRSPRPRPRGSGAGHA